MDGLLFEWDGMYMAQALPRAKLLSRSQAEVLDVVTFLSSN